jgi:hypothetical protein
VAEIIAEDFGRCVLVKRKPVMLWVACASLDESPTNYALQRTRGG